MADHRPSCDRGFGVAYRAVPWQSDAAFAPAFETFWRLSRTPAQKAEDAERLERRRTGSARRWRTTLTLTRAER